MKSITILVAFLVFSTFIKAQSQKVKILNLDTLSGGFLLENDYRLNSQNDIILRPPSIIWQPFGNKLKLGYKKGLFLFGDSLSLGFYKDRIHTCGYDVIGSQKFQKLLFRTVSGGSDKVSIEGYQFLALKASIVVGCLGNQEVPVMWKQNKIKLEKIPLYYVLEIL